MDQAPQFIKAFDQAPALFQQWCVGWGGWGACAFNHCFIDIQGGFRQNLSLNCISLVEQGSY